MKKMLIIGGAGFIGSNACYFFSKKNYNISVIDSLSYASNLQYINPLINQKKIRFVKTNISNYQKLNNYINKFNPQIIINFAAESHVDNSIKSPNIFFKSNVSGVYNILLSIKNYNKKNKSNKIKFFQVSTDEVYGSLHRGYANEDSPLNPSSPYSSSKAAADCLVMGMCKTYNIEYYISRCTNNFGPFQFPEKLIPLSIKKSLNNKPIELYGDGKNKRDWIFVLDHIRAINNIIKKGKTNQIYNIGAQNTYTNLFISKKILSILKDFKNRKIISKYNNKISFINDRPAHDFRYAVSTKKIMKDTGWNLNNNFDKNLYKTVLWYITFFKKKINE